MLRRVLVTIVAAASLFVAVGEPALAATRIKFPRGSYCGSYSGNYHSGRTFVLNLRAGQRFIVRNTGTGRQTTWYVDGPYGELDGRQVDRSTIEYWTDDSGDHYVYVSSTSTRSSVQFCAY